MEEEWELVDIIGEFTAWALAPSSNTLLYSIGSQLIVWDLDNDQKFHLRCHNNSVACILFDLTGEFFITAEKSADPFLSLWHFEDLSQKCVKFLPSKLRKNSLFKLDLALFDSTLLVLEVEKDSGYRVSRWHWEESDLSFLDCQLLDPKEKCFKIRFLSGDFFFTSEKTFLKIWENSKSIRLEKSLYFKSEIKEVDYSSDLGAFGLLLKTGQFLVVNPSGHILTSFSENYSAFSLTQEYLFLAGSSLQVFSLKNYSLISEISKSESMITEILVNNCPLACVSYENSSKNIIDLEKSSILRTVAYHGTAVHSFVWGLDGNFLTAGFEANVYVWTKQESGWGLEAMQLSSEQITSIDLNQDLLAVGFDSGTVKTYNQDFELTSTCRLSPSKVLKLSITHSKVLLVQHENGPLLLLDRSFIRIGGILHDSKAIQNKPFSYCELSDSRETLILVSSLQDDRTISIHRLIKRETIKIIGFSNLQLDSKCEDFQMHTSGKYLLVALDLGCICLFEVFTSSLVGVIQDSGRLALDSSGLYLACLLRDDPCKVTVYEVGTGEVVAEMGRIVAASQVFFSFDGKLLSIVGLDGKIEIWRLPQGVRHNIEKMLSRGEEDVWERFPIVYENTTIKKKNVGKKIPEEAFVDNSAFTETVVSLVQKPKKNVKQSIEVTKFKPPEIVVNSFLEQDKEERIKKLYVSGASFEHQPGNRVSFVHQPQEFRTGGLVDSPVSFTSFKKKENKARARVDDEPISFSRKNFGRESVKERQSNPFYTSK
jgi:hypothetical protein